MLLLYFFALMLQVTSLTFCMDENGQIAPSSSDSDSPQLESTLPYCAGNCGPRRISDGRPSQGYPQAIAAGFCQPNDSLPHLPLERANQIPYQSPPVSPRSSAIFRPLLSPVDQTSSPTSTQTSPREPSLTSPLPGIYLTPRQQQIIKAEQARQAELARQESLRRTDGHQLHGQSPGNSTTEMNKLITRAHQKKVLPFISDPRHNPEQTSQSTSSATSQLRSVSPRQQAVFDDRARAQAAARVGGQSPQKLVPPTPRRKKRR